MVRLFAGGVHLDDAKARTDRQPIRDVPPPPVATLPMVQHIGAPCKPLVSRGDAVKKGQLVGEAGGFVSANVHASTSGKVVSVESRPHYLGISSQAVTIEADGEDAWAVSPHEARDTSSVSADEIRQRVREAGVVGLGGATFPTHVKLSPPPDKPIDSVILNGVECEPYQTCDHALMLETPATIVEGLRLVMRAVNARRGYIGVEANKPDACEAMEKATAGDPSISCHLFPVKYPQGSEKQLIMAILRRKVPAGGLPMDVGVLVHNVGTAHAIYEAVALGKPTIDRVTTVTGDVVDRPGNFRVRLGTPVKTLMELAEVGQGITKLIVGGPMMGIAQCTSEVSVVKGTTAILCLKDARRYDWQSCIRCGKCLQACPMGLNPSVLGILCENRQFEAAEQTNLMDCFECGCCTYVCPARRPIIHWVKWGKAELARKKAQKAK